MLDVEKKQQVLAQFSAYLDSVPDELVETIETENPKIDLYRLFTELAALKSEVKIESRQVKTAIDEFQGLTDLLQKNNEQLNAELIQRRQQQVEHKNKIEKPLLMALLDLHDRIEAGISQAETYQPGWFARRDADTIQHIQSLHDGMDISLRRLDVLLERYDIKPIITIGQTLDPHTMQVGGTLQQADKSEGVVLMETRKGYMREEQLMRLAEVTVNKVNVTVT